MGIVQSPRKTCILPQRCFRKIVGVILEVIKLQKPPEHLRFSENSVCGKMNVFLGFGTMPIFGDPENPAFCSTPRFDDPYSNPYDANDFPKTGVLAKYAFS